MSVCPISVHFSFFTGAEPGGKAIAIVKKDFFCFFSKLMLEVLLPEGIFYRPYRRKYPYVACLFLFAPKY
jgi:hypothetical protein